MDSAFVSSIYQHAQREVKTTIGRRANRHLSRSAAQQPPARPPGTAGLVVHSADDDGWDVIERVDSTPRRHVAEFPQRAEPQMRPASYLVGGEASVEDEDAEYRRIWNLPEPPHLNDSDPSRQMSDEPGLEPLSTGPSTPAEPAPAAGEDDAAVGCIAEAVPATREAPREPAVPRLDEPFAQEDAATGSGGSSGSDAAGSEPEGEPAAEPAAESTAEPTEPAVAAAAAAEALDASVWAAQARPPDSGAAGEPGAASWTPPPPAADPLSASWLESAAPLTLPDCLTAAAAPATAPPPPAPLQPRGAAPAFSREGRIPAAPAPPPGGAGIASWAAALLLGLASAAHHGSVGILQAHHPRLLYRHAFVERHSRRCVRQCLVLDLLLFRGALLLYEHALPALCRAMLDVELRGDWRYEHAVLLLWTLPAYLVCELVSTSWHYKMAQKMAYASPLYRAALRPAGGAHGGAHARDDPAAGQSPIDQAVGIIYTRLVYVAFLLQVRLLGAALPVPALGVGVTLVLSALVHSYDCFEVCWGQQGKDVQQRFRLIEEHWLFFLGYGALLATLSVLLRFWDLFVIRAVLYPMYIANAPHARFERLRCRPLPVFHLAFGVINGVLTLAELNSR